MYEGDEFSVKAVGWGGGGVEGKAIPLA